MKMELEINTKLKIAKMLLGVTNLDELAVGLNDIQGLLVSENSHYIYENKKITVQHLKYVIYSKKSKYKTFEIAKKSGGLRSITSPNNVVKHIQSLLNIALQCYYTPYPTTTGFVPGRSIVTNAQKHIKKKYVYNLDLEDFFPSITYSRIKAVLEKIQLTRVSEFVSVETCEPINSRKTIHPQVAHYIANICCHEGKLPQGAPTSPAMSNIVCKILDYRLYKLAVKYGMTFSRYADDITFSSNKPVFTDDLKNEIFAIITGQGFKLNLKKERLQVTGKDQNGILRRDRQEVTGLTVNKRTNVSKKYIRNLKAAIYNWETKGYVSAEKLHRLHYVNEKGFLRYEGNMPKMELVLGGKLEFLGMVRGKSDTTYRLLKLRFDQLCKKQNSDIEFLNEILDVWNEKGLKKAIDRFYNRQKNIKND